MSEEQDWQDKLGGYASLLLVLSFTAMMVLYFGLEEHQFKHVFEQPIGLTWEQLTTNCDERWEEMQVDRQCRVDPSCTLTRDEMLAETSATRTYYSEVCYDYMP